MQPNGYKLVQLVNGTFSVHSIAEKETFHPVIGPAAEAEALYVRQIKLGERLAQHSGEFVIWDVGLGAAANVLTVLRATSEIPSTLHIVSFDHTPAPLQFAAEHAQELGYFTGYEAAVKEFLQHGKAHFTNGKQTVNWQFQLGDFPSLITQSESQLWPKPHAILFDAFSPAKNPAMWTLPLFTDLFRALDPQRPCVMPTYSRSTMLRVTLLLAGFFVGVGHATGEKEETTIASNAIELLDGPLDQKWLERVRNSRSAEPMAQPIYGQKPISPESWERLLNHPQFK